jgi:hypothetical protein
MAFTGLLNHNIGFDVITNSRRRGPEPIDSRFYNALNAYIESLKTSKFFSRFRLPLAPHEHRAVGTTGWALMAQQVGLVWHNLEINGYPDDLAPEITV